MGCKGTSLIKDVFAAGLQAQHVFLAPLPSPTSPRPCPNWGGQCVSPLRIAPPSRPQQATAGHSKRPLRSCLRGPDAFDATFPSPPPQDNALPQHPQNDARQLEFIDVLSRRDPCH